MRDHRRLEVFKSADKPVVAVYGLTRRFPKHELRGLTTQMRRAAVSVPANIVEGSARFTEREFVRFLEIAFGSLRELEYFLTLAPRLDYCRKEEAAKVGDLQATTARQLAGLIRSMRNR